MKLGEIAELMIGVLTKREQEENGKNTYKVFSLKNYEDKLEYETIKTNKNLNNKLTKKGNLLFRLVYPNKIIYITEELEGLLVPSQFCIIKTERNKLNPIVLKWYLESDQGKASLRNKITGSIIKSIPVSNLKNLEIPAISLKNQEEMEKLISLWTKEKEITEEILEEKEKLYNSYLEKMVNKEVRNIAKNKK